MAILSISSNNPEFSFIIKKNPSSPIQVKKERLGVSYGFFSHKNPQEYNLLFKDSFKKMSFQKKGSPPFEYLNLNQYVSPQAYLSLINCFLNHNLKNIDEVNNFSYNFKIPALEIKNKKVLEIFNTFYSKSPFLIKEVSHNIYSLNLSTTNESFHKGINLLYSFLIFQSVKNGYFFESFPIEKWVTCLKRIDAPYYLLYLFKTQIIPFKYSKEVIENLNIMSEFKFNQGDNYFQRKKAIKSRVFFGEGNLIDIGCGEGNYLKFLENDLEKTKTPYVGYDINKNLIEENKNLIQNTGVVASFTSDWDSLVKTLSPTSTILLSEVIEHLPMKEAKNLLLKIKNLPWKKLIITTPNKDFNKNYPNKDSLRHDDHHFEMTESDFTYFINELFTSHKKDFFNIGDTVSGSSPTIGVSLCLK